ncbi:MAG TPA: hypothetical protein VI685_27805 [Candidatus Angelobacter sp.]
MERSKTTQTSGNDFANAARQRWRELAEKLQIDVAEFNARHGGADFAETSVSEFRVNNLTTGLQLIITADFDARIIRYNYEQMNDKSAGVPEGGMLSMRQSPAGGVEFYSADEQLTSEETREVLLEPVLFPPEMAA